MLATLENFKGKITQTVPAFSAIKISGQKLYDKAIKKTIKLEDLPTRNVEIFDLVLTQLKKDVMDKKVYFSIETTVSSGTYIRSLIHDIGQKLGVGATVVELRRTKIDQYSVTDAIQVFDPETFSFGEKFSAVSTRC
jgi:tRNA pseudouridine55 synthase